MPDERAFLPLPTLLPLCRRSGPSEKSPALKRSRAVSPDNGLPIWSKRRSGKWWETARQRGNGTVDLERHTLDRKIPLALLPPEAPPLVPDPLPDTLLPEPRGAPPAVSLESRTPLPGPTFDASQLPEKRREQFHRNLRAVSQVLAGATQTSVAAESGIPRTTLSRLVRRTKQLGQIACVPLGGSSHGMRNELHHGKKPGSKRQSTWRPTKLLVKERRFLPCKNTIPYGMLWYERESCESAKEEGKNDGASHQAQMVTRRAGSS